MKSITRTAPVLMMAAAGLLAVPVQAQSYAGSGQQATELFRLEAGLAIFELEHDGEGRFQVRLLDSQGLQVEQIADADGPFRGSKAVRLPAAGEYLFDVNATGAWIIRRRTPVTTEGTAAGAFQRDPAVVARAEADADAAATRGWPWGWTAGGFLGGSVAGPLGAGIAVALSGRSDVSVPSPPIPAPVDPVYQEAFQTSFEDQVRMQRRKAALVGGVVGTGVFLAAIIYLVDFDDIFGGGGSEPGPVFVTVPLH